MSAQPANPSPPLTPASGPTANGELTNPASSSPSEPHDVLAYRIAVGAVGGALIVFLLGSALIAMLGKTVPSQYWTAGSAISGALLGILVPEGVGKATKATPPAPTPPASRPLLATLLAPAGAIVKAVEDLWSNRVVLILFAVFAVAAWEIKEKNSTEWQALAAASAGALIGLLAPSPGKKT